ncbi:neurogenic locus Notch protein-like [Ruditapes philippinarum]|uniref:neurogenic locus Notch protein-like n=1 Tax=Ruditapes philippinarum TaxID=129788 RepID=UPI00295B16D4|nr:neurogenic locus Notch protein-like [Ruditapes philippinarum]
MCNSKWTGPACETDVDECTDTTICNSTPNKVCENTLDGYYCTCKVGYTENTDKTCRASTTTMSLSVGTNEYKITLKMALDIPCVAADLQVPTKYDRIKASIESMLKAKLPSTLRVVAYNIRCGSIVFESQIIIRNTDAEKSRVAGDLQNIRNGGTMAVDGVNTKATALTVNGCALSITSGTDNTGTKVCRVHSTLVTCPTGQTCQYVDNTASCRTILTATNKTGEALGAVIGSSIAVFAVGILGAICTLFIHTRKRIKTGSKTQPTVSHETELNEPPTALDTYEQLQNRTDTEIRGTYDSLEVSSST